MPGLDEYRAKMADAMGISARTLKIGDEAEKALQDRFEELDKVAELGQWKVLKAFQENRVSERHFMPTTGYGYDDDGRDTLEKVYASVFETEDALVRPQIISGTHALTVTLFGLLRPGDELIFAVGAPYDTLRTVTGIDGNGADVKDPVPGNLQEFGISVKTVPLDKDGHPDLKAIAAAVSEKTKLVEIQRSRGYDSRPTLSVAEVNEIAKTVHAVRKDVICMVDNCYGEFTEPEEPKADVLVGSLIKNPGGGLAPIGGYVCGRKDLVELVAARLTAPGIAKEAGANLGVMKSLYQGLFMAPTVTACALKTAIFAAKLFEEAGYAVRPRADEARHDIVEAVECQTGEKLLAFCRGIQAAAPVDSYVTPEAWPMPGYEDPVVMAAGTFVSGASIELSADGPMRAPYTAYFQGALTWAHGKLGILKAYDEMMKL